MKKIVYIILIFGLMVLTILSIYNFNHPIKNVRSDIEVYDCKIVNFSKEYDYNEESEYVAKYYIEVENIKNSDHYSVKVSEEKIKELKKDDKISIVDNNGQFYIARDDQKIKKSYFWIILAGIEVSIATFILIKKVIMN